MAVKTMNQTQRRWLFGSNVVLVVIIAAVIVVLLNMVVERAKPAAWDVTTGGRFSLSDRTRKLLEQLETPVYLTSMYYVDQEDPERQATDETQARRVNDLLKRYQDVRGGLITFEAIDPIKDTRKKTALLTRLQEKFSGQTDSHRAAIERFKEQAPDLLELINNEQQQLKPLLEEHSTLGRNANVVTVYLWFNNDHSELQYAVEDVTSLIEGSDIPRYGEAANVIKTLYDTLTTHLQQAGEFFGQLAAQTEDLSDEQKAILTGASDRYAPHIEAIAQARKDMEDLPDLKLEELYDQLKSRRLKVVLVETEDDARVLEFNDVWEFQRQPGADPNEGPQYNFNGEAAVSSAILAMTQKEKAAVVFVYAGGSSPVKPSFGQMRRQPAPFQQAAERLEEANFIVDEWNTEQGQTPPEIEDATRMMYVIMPPPPPQQQNPMQPQPQQQGYSEETIQQITQFLDDGGRAMFLVNFSPQMMMGPSQEYPFTDLLDNQFGFDVQAGQVVLQGVYAQNRTQPNPHIVVDSYGSGEIGDPMGSMPSRFVPAVVVKSADDVPEGVTQQIVASIDADEDDYWGETDVFQLMQGGWAEQGKDDTKPPFVLLGTASKGDTKVVVSACDQFAADQLAMATGRYMMTAQGQLIPVLANPGNIELFVNSMLWLNDSENLIAVGPRSGDVPRIGKVSDAALGFWKGVTWVGWPAVALIIGAIVYFKRRT